MDRFFVFEGNIVYQVQALSQALRFSEMIVLRERVFERHLAQCDTDVCQAWVTHQHLSFSWNNMDAVQIVVQELTERLLFDVTVAKVGIGMYHGNTLVLTVDYCVAPRENSWLPWFYKGFTIKHVFQ